MTRTFLQRLFSRSTLVLSALCSIAQANPITPTDTYLVPASTSLAAMPSLAGAIIADETTSFSYLGVSGSIQSKVVRETASGTLDFYWRVANDSTSERAVELFRVGSFNDPTLDFFNRTDSIGTINPGFVYSYAAHPGYFDVGFCDLSLLGACGDTSIGAGASSVLFMIRTSATEFAKTAIFDLSSGNSMSDAQFTFSPAAVPEPSTSALFGLGIAGLGVVCRNRRLIDRRQA